MDPRGTHSDAATADDKEVLRLLPLSDDYLALLEVRLACCPSHGLQTCLWFALEQW